MVIPIIQADEIVNMSTDDVLLFNDEFGEWLGHTTRTKREDRLKMTTKEFKRMLLDIYVNGAPQLIKKGYENVKSSKRV